MNTTLACFPSRFQNLDEDGSPTSANDFAERGHQVPAMATVYPATPTFSGNQPSWICNLENGKDVQNIEAMDLGRGRSLLR